MSISMSSTHHRTYRESRLTQSKSTNPVMRWLHSNPIRVILLSFFLVILTGAILLTLPIAAKSGASTPFLHSLFTATSATCVTGLIIYDTATHWTTFGHIVIISLIQIGGLGLITITAFFTVTLQKRLAYQTTRVVQETTGADTIPDTKKVLSRVIALTLGFEALGAALLIWRFSTRMPILDAIPRGIFHGISSFCNAGFDLMGDLHGPFASLTQWNNDPVVLLTTALLIVFGGLGFIVWIDLLGFAQQRHLRFHSKIVLTMTLFLIFSGMLYFMAAEWGNTEPLALGSLPEGQRPLAAFFHSVSLRTAGFNSIDQANLTPASKLMSVIFMYIGAAPASTGGGIKVTTFLIVLATMLADFRGREEAVIFKHRVPREQSKRAFVLFMMGIILTTVSVIWLLFSEREALQQKVWTQLDLLFESISAFGTVGVTSVGTGNLRDVSLYPIILLMYLGRVGPASFAIGLVMSGQSPLRKVHPEGRTLVG